MELDSIEKLLEKYFEAATTVAEEEFLKVYFAQDDVAAHLVQYKPLFGYFSEAKKEQYTKQVPLKTKRKINYKWLSVAATVLLCFGIYTRSLIAEKQKLDEQKAELAYQQTKMAFELLAENLNRGTDQLTYINEFEKAKNKILKND